MAPVRVPYMLSVVAVAAESPSISASIVPSDENDGDATNLLVVNLRGSRPT